MLIYLYVSIMLLFSIRHVQVFLLENRLLEEECKVIWGVYSLSQQEPINRLAPEFHI